MTERYITEKLDFFKSIRHNLSEQSDAQFFAELSELIERKTARLTYLKRLDLIEWADKYGNDAASFKTKERDAVQKELVLLISAANYINDFEEKYETERTELLDCITRQFAENQQLKAQIISLQKNKEVVSEMFQNDNDFMSYLLNLTLTRLILNS